MANTLLRDRIYRERKCLQPSSADSAVTEERDTDVEWAATHTQRTTSMKSLISPRKSEYLALHVKVGGDFLFPDSLTFPEDHIDLLQAIPSSQQMWMAQTFAYIA